MKKRLIEEHLEDVVMDVLKTGNLQTITTLKQLVATLSVSVNIRDLLLDGVEKLIVEQPAEARLAIFNYRYLLPELDLLQVAQQRLTQQLEAAGFLINRDFWFDATDLLQSNEQVEQFLLKNVTDRDRILLMIVVPLFI